MPASSSAVSTKYVEETTRGVTPTTGNHKTFRTTSPSLEQTVESKSSQELRNDRMVPDSVLVSGQFGGSLGYEFSHTSFDDFLEATLASTFTDCDAAAVDNVYTGTVTFDGAGGITGAVPDDLEVGQWFAITGTTSNNKVHRVAAITTPGADITVDTDVNTTTVEASVSANFSSSRLKNGLEALRTFTIEEAFTDLDPVQYFTYRGMGVSNMSLDYATGDLVKGTFNFIGAQANPTDEVQSETSALPGTAAAATTTGVMNSVTGTYILVDDTILGTSYAESFGWKIGTGLRGLRGIGTGLSFADVNVGTFEITADFTVFFAGGVSAALYNKMIADTPISISICVTDADGNGLGVTLGRAKIASASVVAGSMNTDVVMKMSVTATIDTTVSNAMIAIDRVGSTA